MKSRRWIAAAALAAAVVFLVMLTGERGPAAAPAPSPVSSSEAVLASDGGQPEDAGKDADREEVVDALQGLLEALDISADELGGCAGKDAGKDEAEKDAAEKDAEKDAEKEAEKDGAGKGRAGDDGEKSGSGGCESGSGSAEKPSSSGSSGSEPASGSTITITGFAFGAPLTVAPGATVKVVNTDAAPHNVTADDGSFETPDLNQDDTATITAPSKPGRYAFSCTLHPEMTGTLVVEGGDDRAQGQDRGGSSEQTPSRRDGGGTSGGGHSGEHPTTTAPNRGSSDGY